MKYGNKLYFGGGFSKYSSQHEESLELERHKQKMLVKWAEKTHLFGWSKVCG